MFKSILDLFSPPRLFIPTGLPSNFDKLSKKRKREVLEYVRLLNCEGVRDAKLFCLSKLKK